jgi:hypothetical protein
VLPGDVEYVTVGQPGEIVDMDIQVQQSSPTSVITKAVSTGTTVPIHVPTPTISWRGMDFRRLIDPAFRQHAMRFLGAQNTADRLYDNIQYLVHHGYAFVECNDSITFTFTGTNTDRQYSQLSLLMNHLPQEWTEDLTRTMQSLLHTVNTLLEFNGTASTRCVDVNMYSYVSKPHQTLVVHALHTFEKTKQNRVSEMMFGKSDPAVQLTTQLRVLTLTGSFRNCRDYNTGLALGKLEEMLMM